MRNDLEPSEDIGLTASLMPNRTRAKLMRASASFCLSISLLFGFPLGRIIFYDLYARVHWPVAEGVVRSYQQESAAEHSSGTRSTSGVSWTVYWIEFEVGLKIPTANCKTGNEIVGGGTELGCGIRQMRAADFCMIRRERACGLPMSRCGP